MELSPITIFWFRRDLRLDDNTGLYHALKDNLPVLPLFIFDSDILEDLDDDPRITFIHQELQKLDRDLKQKASGIEVRYGKPYEVWEVILRDFNVKKVYVNNQYEPYAVSLDQDLNKLLKKNNVNFYSYKDHVLLEKNEVLKNGGDPYIIYTPYSRKWKKIITPANYKSHPSALYSDNFYKFISTNIPSPQDIGFKPSPRVFPSGKLSESLLINYGKNRDYPRLEGTSGIGIHLRFGTISIRNVASKAKELSDLFLNQLIWRDFYQMILWHYPSVVTENFNRKYDKVEWRNNEEEFNLWKQGKTGYPIVDAGIRQLNQTGFMHNRVRMITASFLSKHLLIDWRWGEAYFARKLLDYELASNNGGWQWAAGTGVDAAPYFRIFNPELQEKKFDSTGEYVKRWVPEMGTKYYPRPLIDHKTARDRALSVYKKALQP